LLLLAACTPAAAPAQSTAAPAAPKTVALTKIVVTEGAHVIGFAPLYIAMDSGYFRDEGLEVELSGVGGGTVSVSAVVGGSSFLGFTGLDAGLTAARKGSPIRVLVATTNQFGSNVAVSNKFLQQTGVTPKSPLEDKIKALRGARIAVTSLGSGTDKFMRLLVQKVGMNPDTDVQILAQRDAPVMLAALQQGSIDAVVLSPPTGEQAEAGGYATVLINPLTGEVPEVKGMIFHGAVANLRDIQERRSVMVSAIKAIVRGQQFMRTSEPRAKEILANQFAGTEPKVFELAYQNIRAAFSTSPIPTRESVDVAIKFASILEGQSIDTPYEAMVDPGPAEEALKQAGG
jgi:NitT/TauT family transport system substrate-binding protein